MPKPITTTVDSRFILVLFLVLIVTTTAFSANSDTPLPSSFGWKEKSFSGNTVYSMETSGDSLSIRGQTNGAASALYRNVNINVAATPVLSWRWKVSNVFKNPDERSKSGEDFPARFYVVYKKGYFNWSTVVINYVWSSSNEIGDSWSSAYTRKSQVVVLQSGEKKVGQWVHEKRNIVADFKRYFDLNVTNIDGYAIMVDGDNTGSNAISWFADIEFSGVEKAVDNAREQ